MAYYFDNLDTHFQPYNSDTSSTLPEIYKFKNVLEFKNKLINCKANLFSGDFVANAIKKSINEKMEKYITELVGLIEKNSSQKEIEEKINKGLDIFKEDNNCRELIKLLSLYKCAEQQKEVKHNFGMTIAELEKSTDILTGITPGFSR